MGLQMDPLVCERGKFVISLFQKEERGEATFHTHLLLASVGTWY